MTQRRILHPVRDDQDAVAIAYDVDQWQRILNAQEIPERRRQRNSHVRVTARLVWERDGEQRIDTVADAWTRNPDLVHVELTDTRYRFRGLWLLPADVERR